jgi:hypothetical protein
VFGIGVGGCLELTLVVVWNCSWCFFGIVVDGYEWTLLVVWNERWWLFGIVVGGCLELTLVVFWNCR